MTIGYLLAHDLGTSGNKATLFDLDGNLVSSAVSGYPVSYPHSRWVEQNPEDWWDAVCTTTRRLIADAQISPREIHAVSFSAQMMGCLLLGRDGVPLRPMITWADTRAQAQERWMIDRVGLERGYRITGHRLSASYSAAKLLWVRENEPTLYDKTWKMVHAKDYVAFRLTGELVTDFSDGSSTNLMDIERKEWSQELLDAFEIDRSLLPNLVASTTVTGTVTKEAAIATGLAEGTPVVVGGGDGSCAAVGAGVVHPGEAYNVIGTSSWISTAATQPYFDPAMQTFNWVHLDPTLYTPCGTMQAAGLSYQWYRDTLCAEDVLEAREKGVNAYKLIDAEAASAPAGSRDLLFLPYLVGERSPWWNHDASGAFIGLRADTDKGCISRSVLEGVGYNLRVILEALRKQQPIDEVSMIGGGAKGELWLQILCDIWDSPLGVLRFQEEATSMGAAICAGVGIGVYDSFESCVGFNPVERRVTPNPETRETYARLYPIFKESYQSLEPIFRRLAV